MQLAKEEGEVTLPLSAEQKQVLHKTDVNNVKRIA